MPAFIGLFESGVKESHSLRQFHVRDFLSIFTKTTESTILSAIIGEFVDFIGHLEELGPRNAASAIFEWHFHRESDPEVHETYRQVLAGAPALGPVVEESKKTSIHLVARTAFAGVATRRSSLILTLKSAKDLRSPRIEKTG